MNIARHMNLSYFRSVKAMRRQGKYHSVIEATAARKISNRKAAKLCADTLIDRLPAQIPRKDGGLIPGELRIGRAKKAAGGRMLATGLTRDLASEAEQSRVGNRHNAGSPKSSHHAQWRAESGHSGRPPGDVLAAASAQISAQAARPRRPRHSDGSTPNVCARDSGTFAGVVWTASVAPSGFRPAPGKC